MPLYHLITPYRGLSAANFWNNKQIPKIMTVHPAINLSNNIGTSIYSHSSHWIFSFAFICFVSGFVCYECTATYDSMIVIHLSNRRDRKNVFGSKVSIFRVLMLFFRIKIIITTIKNTLFMRIVAICFEMTVQLGMGYSTGGDGLLCCEWCIEFFLLMTNLLTWRRYKFLLIIIVYWR